MAAPARLTVDLALPPARRWAALAGWGPRIGRLLAACSGPGLQALAAREELMRLGRSLLPLDLLAELDAVAALSGIDPRLLLLANATYDLVKFGVGCSAVAVDTPRGPLHGRNLDWFAPDDALAAETLVCDFVNAPAGPFTSVGWPGFIGVLSGCAPGRFSITLNAASSADPPVPSLPVALLLRQVFAMERSFAGAVARLAQAPLGTDCLILVAGTRPGEMAVIERTPARHAVRRPVGGAIRVTNDYVALASGARAAPDSDIHSTSCSRYQRLGELLAGGLPAEAAAMRRLLADGGVQMPITVQRMVFAAATGLCEVEPVAQGLFPSQSR